MTRGVANLEAEIGDNPQKQFGKRMVNASFPTPQVSAIVSNKEAMTNAFLVDLSILVPDPDKPRVVFDDEAMEEMAASIRIFGVMHPIVIRPHETPGLWYIVRGERRWRASQAVGKSNIPCVVTDKRGKELLLMQLHLNLQRADCSPIEMGRSYARLIREYGWSERQAATQISKSQSYVNKIKVIADLPEEVQQRLIDERAGFREVYYIAQRHKQEIDTLSGTSKPKPTRRQSPFEYHTKLGRVVVVVKMPNAGEDDAEAQLAEALSQCRSRQAKGTEVDARDAA